MRVIISLGTAQGELLRFQHGERAPVTDQKHVGCGVPDAGDLPDGERFPGRTWLTRKIRAARMVLL